MRVIVTPRQVGLAVRDKRREDGLTQKQLAKRAGVSERLVVALELGDATGIRLDKLLQVLEALDLSLAVLGAGDDAAPQPSPSRVEYAVVNFSDLPELDFELPPELRFDTYGKGKKKKK